MKVPMGQRLAFSLGHILNDLCASMWFTYLLLFLHKVLKFNSALSGILMLVGQVADGLSTITVGYLIDTRGNGLALCYRYGRRKSWHAFGVICVVLSFPFIFSRCLGCSADTTHAVQAVYYSAFIIIFQFGWATTQISHLSMIPDLSPMISERGTLTSFRYGATVVSNISVYLVAWAFLGMSHHGDGALIGPGDADSFRNIMLVSISIGMLTSVMFHALVYIPRHEDVVASNNGAEKLAKMHPLRWFCKPEFYQTAGIYMSTRLFVNLTQGYIPIYLQVTLQLPGTSVAVIPLVIFSFSFLSSLVTKHMMPKVGIFVSLFLGAAVGIAGCAWIQISSGSDSFKYYGIYGVAALVGIGGSALLITSLTLTADLIGPNTETGAFVYGAMSLSDKLSNGAAFALVQWLIPGQEDGHCEECRDYFRTVLFAVCGGAALAATLFAATMLPFRRQRGNENGEMQKQLPIQDKEDY